MSKNLVTPDWENNGCGIYGQDRLADTEISHCTRVMNNFANSSAASHADLCPTAPCGQHSVDDKRYMNMKHLEAAFEDNSIAS